MKTSNKGIDFIREHEGCVLTAYDDAQPKVKLTANTKIIGTLTIGYGHTGLVNGKPIKWNSKIKETTAVKLLKVDLVKSEKEVGKYPAYHWSQNEFDALVSFAFNIGSINQLTDFGTRPKSVIASKMLLYYNSGGKPLDGLKKRRADERKLFLTPDC
jgi:GH24 family phage-related lysozyme (muramidase)